MRQPGEDGEGGEGGRAVEGLREGRKGWVGDCWGTQIREVGVDAGACGRRCSIEGPLFLLAFFGELPHQSEGGQRLFDKSE